jgi:hypothetical protein
MSAQEGKGWRAKPDLGGFPDMSKAGMLNHLHRKSRCGGPRALLRHCSRKLSQEKVLHFDSREATIVDALIGGESRYYVPVSQIAQRLKEGVAAAKNYVLEYPLPTLFSIL